MSGQSWTKTCGFCKHTFGGPGLIGGDCPNCPKPSDESFSNGLVARGMVPVGYVSAGWVENPNVDEATRLEAARIRESQGYSNPPLLGTQMKQPFSSMPQQQMAQQQTTQNGVKLLPQSLQQPRQQPQQYYPPQQQEQYQQPIPSDTSNLLLTELRRIADALERLSPAPKTKQEERASKMIGDITSRLSSIFADTDKKEAVAQ